jgi:hypothetical protein
VETILSLEDPLIVQFWPQWWRSVLYARASGRADLPGWAARLVAWAPQMREERRQRGERKWLLEQDRHFERRLSFAGRGE